jgi:hypothetical protein
MRSKKLLGVAALATLTCTAALIASPAGAQAPQAKEVPAKVTVITKGLDGPRELGSTSGRFYVAESDTGEITAVSKKNGAQTTEVKNVFTPQGVVKVGRRYYIASGAAEPDATPPPPPGAGSKLLVAKSGHQAKTFANLLTYELRHNPDNQTQFLPDGTAPDSLSNPFYVIKDKWPGGFLLVADGGANDVLKVNKHGRTSTFFVPPSITSGDCANQKQNDDQFGNSCDAVPTGLAFGPDGNLYISALTSEVAGQGRVYVVNRDGKLLRTLTASPRRPGWLWRRAARSTSPSCSRAHRRATIPRRPGSTPPRSVRSSRWPRTAAAPTPRSRCRAACSGPTASSTRPPGRSASSSTWPTRVRSSPSTRPRSSSSPLSDP